MCVKKTSFVAVLLLVTACSASAQPSSDAIAQCILNDNTRTSHAWIDGSKYTCDEYYKFDLVSVGPSKSNSDKSVTVQTTVTGYFVRDVSSQAMISGDCHSRMQGNGFSGETVAHGSKFSVQLSVTETKWSDGWHCDAINQDRYLIISSSS